MFTKNLKNIYKKIKKSFYLFLGPARRPRYALTHCDHTNARMFLRQTYFFLWPYDPFLMSLQKGNHSHLGQNKSTQICWRKQQSPLLKITGKQFLCLVQKLNSHHQIWCYIKNKMYAHFIITYGGRDPADTRFSDLLIVHFRTICKYHWWMVQL